ncbi:hypothetical protein K1T71_009014, partial [Dendrolimus kikuchii]
VNLTWNTNSTVTFYNERFWHFEPLLSNGSLSDEIVSINPVIAVRFQHLHLIILTYIIFYIPICLSVLRFGANAFMLSQHPNMFLKANVSSWLFEGIEDPILDIAQHIPALPFVIPYDKFGWFYE